MLLLWSGNAVDSTDPVLSSPSMASVTATTGVPTVTTNEGNGTLYYAVLTSGGSATDAQIKAGTGGNIVAGKAGNQAVTTTGVQTFSAVTGLTAGTDYEVVFLQTDLAGNDSAQSQASFTTLSLSMFYIPVYYVDVSDAVDVPYYSNHINSTDATRGIYFYHRRQETQPGGGSTYIRCIYDCFESGMRPGVVFPWAPDVTEGTATTFVDGNLQYRKISFGNTDTTRIGWTVPAWVTSTNLDTAIVTPYGGDANYILWRKRAGVYTALCTAQTPPASYQTPKTVSLSAPLQAGDVLMWGQAGFGTGGGGDVFVASIQLYDSTADCDDASSEHWIATEQRVGSRVSVWMVGSTAEGAWRTAPTGQSPVFVGGYAHQINDGYSTEYPTTQTWTKAGASWTPAQGMWNDGVKLARSSTVYYDVTYPTTATLDLTYDYNPFGLVVPTTFTADQDLDTAQLYFCMLPVESASWAFTGVTTAGVGTDKEEFSKATVVGAGFKYFSAPYATATTNTTYMLTTPAGFSMCAYNQRDGSSTINSRDTEDKGGNKVKNYMQLNPSGTLADGASVSGSMVFFQAGAAGPSAADVAAAAALV